MKHLDIYALDAVAMVRSIQSALDSGRPVWVRTYAGAFGIREIKVASNGREALVKCGRRSTWEWLTRPVLVDCYAQVIELIKREVVGAHTKHVYFFLTEADAQAWERDESPMYIGRRIVNL